MRAFLVAVAVAASAVVVSACGGSSSGGGAGQANVAGNAASSQTASAGGSGASSRVTAGPRLIASADAVCKRHNITAAIATTKIETTAELKKVARERVPVEQAALNALTKLTPLAANGAQWSKFIEARRKAIKDLIQISRTGLVFHGEDMLGLFTTEQDKMFAAAKREGLKACSRLG